VSHCLVWKAFFHHGGTETRRRPIWTEVLDLLAFSPTMLSMEISLTPEVEARLARIASEEGKGAGQVVQELVANYLEHDERFRREVRKGLASLDASRFVPHEEVRREMERILNSR
jgi:predicted transcriptional regulator